MATWRSGLSRCVQVAVLIGLGSNPSVVTLFIDVPSVELQGVVIPHERPH